MRNLFQSFCVRNLGFDGYVFGKAITQLTLIGL